MAIQLVGLPSFGTNHGTTDCIGMSQILYHREVTSVPPSRNLVSRFGRGILETIPPTRQQNSYVYLSRSFTNRALNTRRLGVHSTRGDIPGEDLLPAQEASAGAGGLIKSNTYIKSS